MKYDIILLDPNWLYDDQQNNDPARGGITYDVLGDQELAAIPIGELGADNSIMMMWMTPPKIESGLWLMRQYGYRPTTVAFVWVKLNPSSLGTHIIHDGKRKSLVLEGNIYSGLGRYTNANCEFLWLGRKGRGVKRIEKNVKQVLFAPRGKHSRKPWEAYERIDLLFGTDLKRIELFARSPVPQNWTKATGLEYDQKDIRTYIYELIAEE